MQLSALRATVETGWWIEVAFPLSIAAAVVEN